jgi:hypothetical protein
MVYEMQYCDAGSASAAFNARRQARARARATRQDGSRSCTRISERTHLASRRAANAIFFHSPFEVEVTNLRARKLAQFRGENTTRRKPECRDHFQSLLRRAAPIESRGARDRLEISARRYSRSIFLGVSRMLMPDKRSVREAGAKFEIRMEILSARTRASTPANCDCQVQQTKINRSSLFERDGPTRRTCNYQSGEKLLNPLPPPPPPRDCILGQETPSLTSGSSRSSPLSRFPFCAHIFSPIQVPFIL